MEELPKSIKNDTLVCLLLVNFDFESIVLWNRDTFQVLIQVLIQSVIFDMPPRGYSEELGMDKQGSG